MSSPEFDFDPSDYIAPHCNPEVLHEPGACFFCDKYPDRQEMRIASGTPFSPVEQPWPGNRPEGYADWFWQTWDTVEEEPVRPWWKWWKRG